MAHTLTVSAQDGTLPAAIYSSGYGSVQQGVPGWRIQCSCGFVEKAQSEYIALQRFTLHTTRPQKG
jgi:hypothetical protein